MAEKQLTPVARLKNVLSSPTVQEQFQNAMDKGSDLFVASIIDLYAGDTYLQKCDPNLVVMEALKAATLKIPINKALGYAYIFPYKNKPMFQLGYKGMIQLAMRTGKYKYLNAGTVYDGEYQGENKLTGEIDISGEKKSDEVIGYFSYLETINGFKKTMFMKHEDMERYAKKYSQSFDRASSPWKKEFDKMAQKTMLRRLLSTFGLMSIEMSNAIAAEEEIDSEISGSTEYDIIDIETGEDTPDEEEAFRDVPVDSDGPEF